MQKHQLKLMAMSAFCLVVMSCDQYSPAPEGIATDQIVEPLYDIVDEFAPIEEVLDTAVTTIEKAFSQTDMGLRSFFAEYDIVYADILAMDAAIKEIAKAGFKPNDILSFSLEDNTISQLNWYRDAKNIIEVTRQIDGTYTAKNTAPEAVKKTYIIDSTIDTNFYRALKNDGIPEEGILEMARVIGFFVNFRSDIHEGNKFKGQIVCDAYESSDLFPEGAVENCRTEYAYASIGYGVPEVKEVFSYEIDGEISYLNANGEAAGNLLMSTPINGARLSSSFNPRRLHPISKRVRPHKGTDFAAPTGTAIYAAGDGVVERANRYGGYGNYVRIRHVNGYKTAYAHMSRFTTTTGARVRQGQIIGYVGSTGASTGPHLHYEVYLDGKAVNSQSLKMPPVVKLEGTELEAYQDTYVTEARAAFVRSLAKKRWDDLQLWAGRGFNALTHGPS
jgi:murein DD-endopeptidase MepM/ murein hydrolase activator NlpD